MENRDLRKRITDLRFHMQENSIVHNSYLREQRTLECIRNGDCEGVKASEKEPMGGQVGRLAKDPLRSRKNVAICAMAIYTRAAIDGGILSDDAFAAGDAWALKIEDAVSVERLNDYAVEMPLFFARMVAEHKEAAKMQASQKNRLVERCKKYIFQHLHEKITVKMIADSLYVNADYLSNTFSKYAGVTISCYIQNERIKQAKNLLIYSPYDCRSIANYLGFSSQSHFGKVFKEAVGMTPNEYRVSYGKETF